VEWYYVEPQPSGQRSIEVTFTNGRLSSIQSVSAIPWARPARRISDARLRSPSAQR